jgi:DHA1 family bicyclomycin/chloramphenicol resistance-like MFS transporter
VTTTAPAASSLQVDDPQERRERLKLILVLGALIALGPLTIDMYLPALPSITRELETTSALVQLTLTGTLIGVAVGQLLIGPLSDAFGRRLPLLLGIGVHVLASVLCVFAPTVEVLGWLRVLQGLGAAAASVTAMAVVRDRYTGVAAATVLSRLMLVLGVAPVLAPTLGGELLRYTDWRGVFVALAVAGLAMMLMAARALEETLPPERRRSGRLGGTLRAYRGILRDRTFVGLILAAGLSMAALFAYVSGSSFVLQEQYGLDEQQFAIAFGAGAVGLIGASQLNVRLLRRFRPQQVLVGTLASGLGFALLMLLTASTGFGGLPGLLLPLWAVLATVGLALPNTSALAISRHGEAAGTAAALLGATQFGVAAATAPFVGVLGNDGLAMALVVTAGLAGALAVVMLVVKADELLSS